MLSGKNCFISVGCSVLLFTCSAPKAEAGLLSFMGRHIFGRKKDHASKSQASTKQTQVSHATKTFSANASWYGGKFNGRRTASGEVFDQNKLTAASRTLPLGTKLLVKNPANGKSCTVVVNDRGPFVSGRDIDLSRAAAQKIGVTGVSPIDCVADTSGAINYGSTSSHGGGLLHFPGKVFHMIAGII
jgi:rare lipoprotein A (peptidoglycan hydrolase)